MERWMDGWMDVCARTWGLKVNASSKASATAAVAVRAWRCTDVVQPFLVRVTGSLVGMLIQVQPWLKVLRPTTIVTWRPNIGQSLRFEKLEASRTLLYQQSLPGLLTLGLL
eukprot:356932-Chlamydomonas_euryale.AAC.3